MYTRTSAYLKKKFGTRVQKIALHGGLTCPNRDGKVGYGGCAYCNNQSFSPFLRGDIASLRTQIERGIAYYKGRGVKKVIAYFQSYTNTYAPVEYLHGLYELSLSFEDVVGLSVGTRPDTLEEDVLSLLESYQERGWLVIVELGVESSHDRTLEEMNRGHTFDDFIKCVHRVKQRGLFLVAHLILGLPKESVEDMQSTAKRIASLPIDALKLHHFYIARGTAVEQSFLRGEIQTMSVEEYGQVLRAFLRFIPENILIERILGETNPAFVRAPLWDQPKPALMEKLWKMVNEDRVCA